MRRFEEQNNFLLLFRSLTSALFQTRQYYLSPHLSAETTWKKRKFEFHGCTFDIFSEAIHQKKMHMLWRISLYAGGCERGEGGGGKTSNFFKCILGLTTSLRGRTGIIYSSLPEKQSCWFRTLVHYSVKSIYYPNWPKRCFSNMLELDRNYTHSNVWQDNNETS